MKTKLTNLQIPILSESVEEQIDNAIESFLHRGQWKEWGMDRLREQGAALLLHGPSGTGKTITAYWIGRKLHLKVVEISMADYGSDEPGELARNIKRIFTAEQVLASQERRHLPILFLDECDAMLVSRKKLGSDMIWMLEPINALLSEIGKYPGLVILATNIVSFLDEALERRLLAKILFERPDTGVRYKIWKSKWPEKYPCQPTERELQILALADLSGAQIENCLILWTGRCMRRKEQPVVSNLIGWIKEYIG